MIKGTVELIHTANRGAEKVTSREEIVVIAGRGIEGDRYYEGKAHFLRVIDMQKGGRESGFMQDVRTLMRLRANVWIWLKNCSSQSLRM